MERYGNETTRVVTTTFAQANGLLAFGQHWKLFAKTHPKWLDGLSGAQRGALLEKVLPGLTLGLDALAAHPLPTRSRAYQTLAGDRFMQSAATANFVNCIAVLGIRKTWLPIFVQILNPETVDAVVRMVTNRFKKYEDPATVKTDTAYFKQFWMDLVKPDEQRLRDWLSTMLPGSLYTVPPDPTAFKRQQQALLSALGSTRRTTADKISKLLGLAYA